MDLPRLLTARVRGQALAENLGALLVGAVIIGAIAYFIGAHVGYWVVSRQHNANEGAVSALVQELYRDGQSSETPYLPNSDVGNQSNSDGHELDFYQIGANHAGYFWAYCYKASANACTGAQSVGTLQRYRYKWSDLPQNGGTGATAQGSAAPTYVGFAAHLLQTQADYADATKNPLAATYFQHHTFSFAGVKVYHWAYPGVVSQTSAAYAVTLTLPNKETRSFGIAKHHIVFGQTVLYGSATPTPNPFCVGSCPNSTATLSYQNPIAAAQNATVYEQNYGTRSTSPAQVYNVSGCSGIANYSPGSPLTPSNNGTGAATLTVTPVKQVAPNGLTCTIMTTDNANQTNAISVQIGQTYSPSSTGPGAGLSGQTVAFTVTEQNYNTAPSGGFSASISGACNSIAQTSTGVSGGIESESWNVHFANTGGCTVVFTDVYGQTTQAVTNVACSSYGTPCALGVSPTSMTIWNPPGGAGEPTSANVSVSESNQYNSFSINDSGCRNNGYATANTSSLGTGGGTFTITAGANSTPPNATCPIVVTDGNGQSATINVLVDPISVSTPGPSPTPSGQNVSGTFSIKCTNSPGGAITGPYMSGNITCTYKPDDPKYTMSLASAPTAANPIIITGTLTGTINDQCTGPNIPVSPTDINNWVSVTGPGGASQFLSTESVSGGTGYYGAFGSGTYTVMLDTESVYTAGTCGSTNNGGGTANGSYNFTIGGAW